ncbi:FGGY carbohydrate kinase domain-containing protein [Stylophora pistillata]|uniref:FGGY carbohydrate kinase domain-containing protein n=1 Tax=Stylophora pistillata TaxID=50429 RepID=A0A2B4RWB8_STYPI|nr:FGGY carbohydrate kinase domain-containing protein [Stylophora pistillata]
MIPNLEALGGPKNSLGVDVGTASVRAALITHDGRIVSSATQPLQIWQPLTDYYEQSSEDVWRNVCLVVKEVGASLTDKGKVKGIGFDATCSLVTLDSSGGPVTCSPSKEPHRNIIMWLDHRAMEQAERVNSTKHKVLTYVGGATSPEMEIPKMLWLKENLQMDCWDKCALCLELPEFLTYRATGDKTRLRVKVGSPGEPVGKGLTKSAAAELGLWEGMPVGTSLIDAHAGGFGVIGADLGPLLTEDKPLTSRLAVICGTSSCHMAINQNPVFVPGVWGPYFSAMVPGLWLNEGGQSVTGKLIDHLIETHVACKELKEKAEKRNCSLYEELNNHVATLAEKRQLDNLALLSRDFHVLPDFHGNRSPIGDPKMTGMICGLTLTADLDNLAVLYLAVLQALAHGTRHIVECLNEAGHSIDSLFLCGGLSKNELFIQIHADVTGFPCILPRESESVLVGSAILGACASGDFPSIQEAMKSMNAAKKVVKPQKSVKGFYDKKHQVFLLMLTIEMNFRELMKDLCFHSALVQDFFTFKKG